MLAIAVCDDEVIECSNMAKNIRKILDEMKESHVIRQFNSGQELLRATEQFDIIFLDIIMSGMDGMRAAHIFREKAFDRMIIFMSSSRSYVFEAYDVEAFQYLLKPIDEKKLKRVLQKAVQKIKSHSHDFILVSKERQKQKIFLDDIYYFEIMGRVVYVHGTDGVFAYYEQMGVLEECLKGKGFFRCHKSYLIHLKYVDVYNRQEAILDNGERVVIAKRRYEAFCGEMLRYMREHGGII